MREHALLREERVVERGHDLWCSISMSLRKRQVMITKLEDTYPEDQGDDPAHERGVHPRLRGGPDFRTVLLHELRRRALPGALDAEHPRRLSRDGVRGCRRQPISSALNTAFFVIFFAIVANVVEQADVLVVLNGGQAKRVRYGAGAEGIVGGVRARGLGAV